MTSKYRINPGGHLAPEEVFGRDEFIKDLWKTLEVQSLTLNAERRIGKTSIINKMSAEKPGNQFFITRDVENIDCVHFFVAQLANDLSKYFTNIEKTKNWFNRLRASLGGASFLGIKVPEYKSPIWQKEIEQLFKSVSENLQDNTKLTIVLDEFPWFLQKVMDATDNGKKLASDILDSLRQIRHQCHNIRFIFTGSIGIHHVITQLKQTAKTNQPLNDVTLVRVPTLTDASATELVNALVEGENLEVEEEGFISAVIEKTDKFPFYIHKLLAMFRQSQAPTSVANVNKFIQSAIADEDDNWQLGHYEDRIESYYGNIAPICKSILDIACQEDSVSIKEIQSRLKVAKMIQSNPDLLSLTDDVEFLRKTLQKLSADNYLTQRPADRSYSFLYSLVRRWWQFHRGDLS